MKDSKINKDKREKQERDIDGMIKEFFASQEQEPSDHVKARLDEAFDDRFSERKVRRSSVIPIRKPASMTSFFYYAAAAVLVLISLKFSFTPGPSLQFNAPMLADSTLEMQIDSSDHLLDSLSY